MTASDTPTNDAAERARIATSIDAWRRKLLDLTKRNRALHFRPTKVSTVAVVDEPPAMVFGHLYLRERSMRFKAAPAPEATTLAAAEPAAAVGERAVPDDEDDSPQFDFAPYDRAEVEERHADDWLQTASTPEALDKSLRRLDEQARLSIEEQGVNTLFLALGMLHYVEAASSEQVFRAPVVFLPVQLVRKSARAGYSIRATEDDPMVNPALAEYLRREHGIALPELPDSSSISDDYDLQDLLRSVAASIAEKKGWSLKSSIYLGLFSFQKLVMYKDLEANQSALAGHRIIRQVVLRKANDGDGTVIGLPAEIRDLNLDAQYPPESTYQVVDADSSQLRAIAAVARNHDLVIEGPPGTGKSQTITNLIAHALAAGKSVLFVAEKMAALSVVHDRLVRAGLGEFCLELHSTKANKRAVMQELAAALDASLQRVAASAVSTQRLPMVRSDLRDYVEAVHDPFGSLCTSPWSAYGELGGVLAAKQVKYDGPVDGAVTPESLDESRRRLRELAASAGGIGVPDQHPWRDATKPFFSIADLDGARDEAQQVLSRLAEVVRCATSVRARLGLPEPTTFAEADAVAGVARVMARSPGAPQAVLQSAAWNAAPREATAFIERGRALVDLQRQVCDRFRPEALEQDHADDVAHVERKAAGAFGFLAFLDGRFRAIRRRWVGYRLEPTSVSLFEQAQWMRKADHVRSERRELDAASATGRELFGDLWQGWHSDWDALESYVRWVVEFRQLCLRHGLAGGSFATASQRQPDVSPATELADKIGAARESLVRLRGIVGWPADYLDAGSFESIGSRVRALLHNVQAAPRWAAFESARRAAAATLARDVIPAAMSGSVAFPELESAFRRAFWLRWLTHVVQARPALERFHTMTHEQRVAEFRDLDARVLDENRARLVGELRERVQQQLRAPPAADAMPHLRSQIARQRGLAPLRRTMRTAGAAIRAIKPCFLMSPLTVAQLLDGAGPSFDLAIFDEASQLPPEDAVGAIFRCKQVVVVGDPKQLPPTNFFAVASGVVDAPVGEDGAPTFEDAESVLEHCMGAGFATSRLKWHYRSAHESLIRFSNVQFYDAELYTFPSVERGTDAIGLQFEHVASGIYEGQGLNAAEARRVADEVVAFARMQLARRAARQSVESLGVGTFNLRQQLAIQDELEQRRRADPSIEPFFDRGVTEPFFVKNLENIQGDERDVIFLSVTYARSIDGRLRFNLGPLNQENGWRRLNVLVTRARRRMRVFSSIRADDIGTATTTARGALLLREFLLFAERGRLESASASRSAETESPFERDVLRELESNGVRLVPQVGASRYRIDLGVVDDAAPGRYVCGIECDGVAYHSSETARDRDRLRQQVLELRGWTIHRVWSTDWFKDRPGQIERLLTLIDAARRRARDQDETERRAREQAERESAEEQARTRAEATRTAAELVTAVDTPYERPVAAPYALSDGAGRHAGDDLLLTPVSRLVQAVVTVVDVEGPIHEAELTSRVAGMWSARAGSRIQGRIEEAVRAASLGQLVHRRGAFIWNATQSCVLRSRAGTRIVADRIAPEEYRQAILAVLRHGHGFSRPQLTTEVRAVLGYSRTGATLDEAIGAVTEQMLREGVLGEASNGIRQRR